MPWLDAIVDGIDTGHPDIYTPTGEQSAMDVRPDEGRWDFEGRDRLEAILETAELSHDDVCLVGSISLSARGIRNHNDIDFVVHPDERPVQSFSDEFVSITEEKYAVIDVSDRELIENDRYHDTIDGFKVVRPELSFSYKKVRDQPKDERDVELLTNYSQAADDWDWDLYRSDYSQPPSSLLSRGIQSLRNDGIRVTFDKVVGLIQRKYPVIRNLSNRLPIYDTRSIWDGITSKSRYIDPAALLNRQFVGSTFASYDVVAAWSIYTAFQEGREPQFDPATLGISESKLRGKTADTPEPIEISLKHLIRTPEALARQIESGEQLRCDIVMRGRQKRDDQWLDGLNLTDEQKRTLRTARTELLDNTGCLFYVILWPTVHEYFDEMEERLAESVDIATSLNLSPDSIESFVLDIYDAQAQPVPEWSIEWKAQQMTGFPNSIRVLKVIQPNPRFHDGISREMEMIKNDVRHEFVDNFSDEYYLSLIHATDNFEDNRRVRSIVESYR